jgi:hypothetical protein
MNSAQRPTIAIEVLNYLAKGCELVGIPDNPYFSGYGAGNLQGLRQKSFFAQPQKGLVASHARTFATR